MVGRTLQTCEAEMFIESNLPQGQFRGFLYGYAVIYSVKRGMRAIRRSLNPDIRIRLSESVRALSKQ